MEAFAFILILAVGFGIFIAASYFSESARLKRLLREAPRVDIKDFEDGGVGKISGRLEYLDEPLTSPLNGRTCALYDILVEEKPDSNKNYWRTYVHENNQVRFIVRDNTGYAIVDPSHAQIVIVKDRHSTSGTFNDPTPEEKAFLNRHGKEGQGWVFNKTLRYKEGVLEAGEEVAVLGFGMREPDPDPGRAGEMSGYRSAPPTRLVMSGGGQQPLTVSDEWETLG